MGKIQPYVDVRSAKDVPQFESMLKVGPVFVLVYADWCGHCQTFKKNMWDEVAKSPNKAVNTAAVHYNMVDKTSMNNAKIEGYPTLFEVKPTPRSNVSTPVPTPKTKEELETLVNSSTLNSERLSNPNLQNENMKRSTQMMNSSSRASADTFEPEPIESLPPNVSLDTIPPEMNTPLSVHRGGALQGGSLMETLLKVTADTAHVAILATSASELSHRYKKRKGTKKHRSGRKAHTRRR